MKITIGSRIHEARINKELDQHTLAQKLGIATRTLQRWEKGEQVPDSIYLMKIAKATNVRPEWLLTGEGEMYAYPPEKGKIISLQKETILRKVPIVDIPVLSSVPAGRTTAIFHPEYIERYVAVDNINDPNAFALIVKGTSMSPKIEDGDIVVVSPRREVRNGDICVVRVNDEDVLKKVKFDTTHIHLIPLNPEFEPVSVKKKDVAFIWKVVKVIKNL
ncbi:MAG: LexA repressor [Ignavibacteriae bacterium]|nr:MAG: LexA repressor [Ignavibacteriota bacterium]